jgi:hypothetical protein
VVLDSRSATQSVLGVLLMKRVLLPGIAVLFLVTGTAHAQVVCDNPSGWVELLHGIERDIAQADAEHRVISKLNKEDRLFIRKGD